MFVTKTKKQGKSKRLRVFLNQVLAYPKVSRSIQLHAKTNWCLLFRSLIYSLKVRIIFCVFRVSILWYPRVNLFFMSNGVKKKLAEGFTSQCFQYFMPLAYRFLKFFISISLTFFQERLSIEKYLICLPFS